MQHTHTHTHTSEAMKDNRSPKVKFYDFPLMRCKITNMKRKKKEAYLKIHSTTIWRKMKTVYDSYFINDIFKILIVIVIDTPLPNKGQNNFKGIFEE